MSGELNQIFVNAKRTLRAHPEWDNERVAEQCGLSSRMLTVDERIGSTIDAARREIAADAEDMSRLSVWEGRQG